MLHFRRFAKAGNMGRRFMSTKIDCAITRPNGFLEMPASTRRNYRGLTYLRLEQIEGFSQKLADEKRCVYLICDGSEQEAWSSKSHSPQDWDLIEKEQSNLHLRFFEKGQSMLMACQRKQGDDAR